MSSSDAKQVLDQQFLEMRWRALSLAADLDRVERAAGGAQILSGDERVRKLRQALGILFDGSTERAAQVQMIFSDTTPPPVHKR